MNSIRSTLLRLVSATCVTTTELVRRALSHGAELFMDSFDERGDRSRTSHSRLARTSHVGCELSTMMGLVIETEPTCLLVAKSHDTRTPRTRQSVRRGRFGAR